MRSGQLQGTWLCLSTAIDSAHPEIKKVALPHAGNIRILKYKFKKIRKPLPKVCLIRICKALRDA